MDSIRSTFMDSICKECKEVPYLDIANLLKYNYSMVIIMYALYKNKMKVKIKDIAFKLVSKIVYSHIYYTEFTSRHN